MFRFGRKSCAGDACRLAFLVACLTTFAFGQVTTGDIVGTVTDASGAVIADAMVTVTNLSTQEARSVSTSAVGDYAINLLKPGHYKIHIEAKGFVAYEVADVQVSASSRGRVDAQLKIGNTKESVVVTGELAQLNSQSLRSWEPSVYIQDDWRATSWLTINLGLRWDTSTPVADAHNVFANFDPAQLKVLVAGVNTTSTGGIRTDYKDFAPRIGFAATIAKNTVVRGGYGITYYPVMYTSQLNNQNPPFSYVCFPCFAAKFPIVPLPTAPSATNPSGNVNGEALDLKQGHIHQFNLFVQKQVGANTFTLGGVGELGRNLAYATDLDHPLPPGPGKTATLVYAQQLPNVSAIAFTDNRGISNYYAMQASFTRNLTHGLGANVNYTWGHGLGDNSSSSTSTGPPRGLFPTNPMYDYGNSDIDIRHRVAMSINYQLPFGKGLKGAAKVLAQDWQLSSIAFWQTGIPFTVINNSPQIGIPGLQSDRPNQIAPATLSNPSINKWFNTAAFAPQVAGTPGNEGVNQLHGPHGRAVNLALLKDFMIREPFRLQFRAECFNLSNTASFALPNNSLGSPVFGTISSTAANMSPRQFQFALKLLF